MAKSTDKKGARRPPRQAPPPEALEAIRRLWCVDGLSANAIASRMVRDSGIKISRNAILGHVHRRGWRAPLKCARVVRAQKRVTHVKAARRGDPHLPPLAGGYKGEGWGQRFPAQEGLAVPLARLGGATCRWPVGEESGLHQKFCGAIPAGASPYCPGHAARASDRVRKRDE